MAVAGAAFLFAVGLVVADTEVIEVKAIEQLRPVHDAQSLTYFAVKRPPPGTDPELWFGPAERGDPAPRALDLEPCQSRWFCASVVKLSFRVAEKPGSCC